MYKQFGTIILLSFSLHTIGSESSIEILNYFSFEQSSSEESRYIPNYSAIRKIIAGSITVSGSFFTILLEAGEYHNIAIGTGILTAIAVSTTLNSHEIYKSCKQRSEANFPV